MATGVLRDERYMWWGTRRLVDVAGETAGGRLLGVHEGGSSAAYAPYCGLAVIEELSGINGPVEDPFPGFLPSLGGQDEPSEEATP